MATDRWADVEAIVATVRAEVPLRAQLAQLMTNKSLTSNDKKRIKDLELYLNNRPVCQALIVSPPVWENHTNGPMRDIYRAGSETTARDKIISDLVFHKLQHSHLYNLAEYASRACKEDAPICQWFRQTLTEYKAAKNLSTFLTTYFKPLAQFTMQDLAVAYGRLYKRAFDAMGKGAGMPQAYEWYRVVADMYAVLQGDDGFIEELRKGIEAMLKARQNAGGRSSKGKRCSGASRCSRQHVKTGPRGGKYILRGKRKVYLRA
jgi:hypothetical protein